MSQNDESENDIWDYKPLKKKKKEESPLVRKTKKRGTSRKSYKDHSSSSVLSPAKINFTTTQRGTSGPVSTITSEESCIANAPKSSTSETFQSCNNNVEGQSSGGYCPVCQMPFSILVVQSQSWHVVDCIEFSRDTCKECPDGLLCSSTIPNHYRNYNHTLLAQSRANFLSLPQPAITTETNLNGPVILKTSQDSLLSDNNSSLNNNNHTKSPRIANGLLLLRSPALEDLKKKKGWSSPKVSQKSASSCQESMTEIPSTPSKTFQACNSHKSVYSPPEIDDAISYSPLSELPTEPEVSHVGPRKTLFNVDPGGSENEDDIFAEFLDQFESQKEEEKNPALLHAQVDSVILSKQSNQGALSANKAASKCERENPGTSTSVVSSSENSIQSPQSIVLERLRDTILNSQKPFCEAIQSGGTNSSNKVPSLTLAMTPQKTRSSKAGQSSSGLKQTDIGVFFGLKPLKETTDEPQEPTPAVTEAKSENNGGKTQRKGRPRKSQANVTTENAHSSVTGDSTAAETKQIGAKGWRRRWTAAKSDGDVVTCRRCPFYKKIPGTKLVVDAFRYGLIEGITAYFLTHFHSDHYDGLRKNSTFPIYCNKITGNLVKSKLKVPEQYVHILPMNTEVTVEGIKVILLEANHCPGAAMLLFLLPDGQTVLHTGDFRADSSMETYSELLSCRVQTLYLDTTYCSPEYTFPKQQEVINYAVNTAFELVTLNPRTLVVCGSYSVGKEKVFLGLADVLGSKVCLSRDKFNTMCCLESEEIKQRITTDWKAAQVHVLPMMQLSFKKLQDHLARFSAKYDKLVAFKPTGWTFSQQVDSVENIQPQINGNISIYGIPYSEHSSFLELKRFVQWLRPVKIIPTVNNGSWESRKAMERCFSDWLKESRAKLLTYT